MKLWNLNSTFKLDTTEKTVFLLTTSGYQYTILLSMCVFSFCLFLILLFSSLCTKCVKWLVILSRDVFILTKYYYYGIDWFESIYILDVFVYTRCVILIFSMLSVFITSFHLRSFTYEMLFLKCHLISHRYVYID